MEGSTLSWRRELLMQPGWISAMEMAQRAIPGIVCGRTMAAEPGTYVGLFHDVCGTLNGRRLADGTMLYGALPDLKYTLLIYT